MIWEDLGAVSAYAIVKEKGYTGTEEEFARMLINAGKLPELMKRIMALENNKQENPYLQKNSCCLWG